ncbi:MetQ/NlpA family ABC transporter substrate-binding protein [Rathayibacter sp. VKM Ac-2803]|uniref:MetQ/NlpA family ABC transporter substrate-binding protein n=1 Tax=unclassified Rathayibacter TaxID=2609250 RepID=UPI001358490F|nr:MULTISPECIES: MetQ/NlpA family ABC transporter substrate-binding protein [unclassified Rathayibacter]MWV48306.1 MetQ/NlpA family ABC transporter substrate-binding protein [Rathayibacter sp. VKM Ac-2803]MWV59201.1 MetQ/NlpA family ABC transporter substrate-binding protein [Rathayibacter sp. VKM Ac-2754]
MNRTSFRTPLVRLGALAAAGTLLVGLAACSSDSGSAGAGSGSDSGDLGTIRVGALATPAGDLLTWVDENLAEEAGLDIEFVEFSDYNTPNPALSDGSTDANLFQNATFLETYNSQAGGDLVSAGEVYLPAAAFYSESLESLDDLEDGATVAIPNDPTNEGRALKLLASEGIIEVDDDVTNLQGITSNPRDLEFTEIENASLALALPDQDAVFVTATFALPAGLTEDQSILIEGTDSTYYNILATTPDLEDDPRIEALYGLLTDQRTKDHLTETWDGLIVPVS